jgi:hypothetical protein
MTSPYLQQPLVPLAVALPQMLENIEAELANESLEAGEERRLSRRAELIRWLLARSQITSPPRPRSGRSVRTALLGCQWAPPTWCRCAGEPAA